MKALPKIGIHSNIWKLYVIEACRHTLFSIAVVYLFWQSYGLTLRDIMLLQAGYALMILLLEVPTGYIADRWGRKNSIVAGSFCYLLGYIFYASGSGFGQFMLAELTLGVGVSLLSGAMEAMTYDTLLEEGNEEQYRRVASNQAFYMFNAEAIAGVIGAVIAAMVSIVFAVWLITIPMAIAFLTALTLREPTRRGHEHLEWKTVWTVTTQTVRRRGLRSLIVLSGFVSTMALIFFWFFQPYQTLVDFPIALFGLSHAVIVVAGAFAVRAVPWFEKRMDDRILLMMIAAILVACYLAVSGPPMLWLLPVFLVGRAVWGMLMPLTSDMINRMATSDIRATVLSLRSFFARLVFVCVSPLIGALADIYSIPFALFMVGLAGGAVLIILFLLMRPVWKEIPA